MSLRSLLVPVAKAVLFTGRGRYCTVCDRHARRFRDFGNPPRPEARCPWCGSLERHRFTLALLREKTNLFDGQPKRLLHVAPEPGIEPILREACGEGYLSGDLLDPKAMECMDITDIQHPDNSFDVVYCSHVLEHIPDDRQAMREMCRVMKPGGWGLIDAPVTVEQTIEDPSIEDPEERLRRFGQIDHVRRYGLDYADRLAEAGFTVKHYKPEDEFSDAEIQRQVLRHAVYFCEKPA